MLDAMLAITRARAGAAIVTDDEGVVSGLICESDFRRTLLDWHARGEGIATETTSSSPRTYSDDTQPRRFDSRHSGCRGPAPT